MTKTSEQLWKDASSVLRGMLNPDMFARWFAPVKPVELKEDVLVLGVAHEFSQIWLQDNFLPLVREAVNQSSKQPLQVRFAIVPGAKTDSQLTKSPQAYKPGQTNARYQTEPTLHVRHVRRRAEQQFCPCGSGGRSPITRKGL